jgi:hypothetical protein
VFMHSFAVRTGPELVVRDHSRGLVVVGTHEADATPIIMRLSTASFLKRIVSNQEVV